MRFIFDKQTAMGDWEFPLIYGFKAVKGDALLSRWRAKARAWRDGGGGVGGPRTPWGGGNRSDNRSMGASAVMDDAVELRRELGPSVGGVGDGPTQCEVTTSRRLREPSAQYLSFYEYYIRKQQEAEARPSTSVRDGRGRSREGGVGTGHRGVGGEGARHADARVARGQVHGADAAADTTWSVVDAATGRTADAPRVRSSAAELAVTVDGKTLRRVGVHPLPSRVHKVRPTTTGTCFGAERRVRRRRASPSRFEPSCGPSPARRSSAPGVRVRSNAENTSAIAGRCRPRRTP